MNAYLTHLIAQQRQSELARDAERARLANDVRLASTSARRFSLRGLITRRRIGAVDVAPAMPPAGPGLAPEGLRCDP